MTYIYGLIDRCSTLTRSCCNHQSAVALDINDVRIDAGGDQLVNDGELVLNNEHAAGSESLLVNYYLIYSNRHSTSYWL